MMREQLLTRVGMDRYRLRIDFDPDTLKRRMASFDQIRIEGIIPNGVGFEITLHDPQKVFTYSHMKERFLRAVFP